MSYLSKALLYYNLANRNLYGWVVGSRPCVHHIIQHMYKDR